MGAIEIPDWDAWTSERDRRRMAQSCTTDRELEAEGLLDRADRWDPDVDNERTPLRGLAILSAILDAAIRDAVEQERAGGSSWATIGARLGISKQAAQQRFGVKAT